MDLSISHRWTETVTVICNKIWAHHYTPESKQVTMEWRKKGEDVPFKAKISHSAAKVLIIVFYISTSFMNVAYYGMLLDKEKLAYEQKWGGFPIQDVIFLYNNVRPYTATQTPKKQEDLFRIVMKHIQSRIVTITPTVPWKMHLKGTSSTTTLLWRHLIMEWRNYEYDGENVLRNQEIMKKN